jgi:hypothetical protein
MPIASTKSKACNAENAMQRGDFMGGAIDSAAGLFALVSMFHFQGRDDDLAELGDSGVTIVTPETGSGKSTIGNVKKNIDSGDGIGGKLILAITKARHRTVLPLPGGSFHPSEPRAELLRIAPPYSSPSPSRQRRHWDHLCRTFTPAQPNKSAGSMRDYCSGDYTRRRLEAKKVGDDDDTLGGLRAICEAVASLKSSGEHDRIIAEQAELSGDSIQPPPHDQSRWRLVLIPDTREQIGER